MVGDRPLLQAHGLTKSFGGARALNEVDLTVLRRRGARPARGERLGQVDVDQGPGRLPHADAGELVVQRPTVRAAAGAGEPQRLGMEFVHQDLGLVASLTVAENLFMADIASPRTASSVSWSPAQRRGRGRLRPLRRHDRPGRHHRRDPARSSGPLVAIVRALEGLRRGSGDEPTLLVLDEPTVFLPQQRGGAAVRPRPADRGARVERAVRVARPGRGPPDHRQGDGAARRARGGHGRHRADLAARAGDADPRPGAPGDGRRRAAGREPVGRAGGARPQHAVAARRVLRTADRRGARAHRVGRLRLRGRRLRDLRRHPGRAGHSGGGWQSSGMWPR